MRFKKGSIYDLFILIAVAMIIVIFFAVIIFGFGILNTQLHNIPDPANNNLNISISTASDNTFGKVNTGMQSLKFISFFMIFAMAISILISNFFIKSHPLFYGLYILILIIAVVFSVYVSNSYETLLAGSPLSSTLNEFTASTFIILNLPIFIAVVGIFGAIFLFINFPRDRELGGGL